MKTATRSLIPAFLASIFLFGAPLFAADQKDEPKRDLPKSGVLSGGYIGGFEGASIEGPAGFEDKDIYSEERAPITGSVSKQDSNYWNMKIFNNDEDDTYSVNLSVEQVDKRNSKIRSDNFSYTLKPQESQSRLIRSRPNTANMILKLSSWKRLGGKKKQEEGAAEAAEESVAEDHGPAGK
ncbi:MAG: hypothetical protein KDD64_15210 [Bdellovibrionales bacterium]|nr:hypothetical protein [Bdellovibrionales bacterium]